MYGAAVGPALRFSKPSIGVTLYGQLTQSPLLRCTNSREGPAGQFPWPHFFSDDDGEAALLLRTDYWF